MNRSKAARSLLIVAAFALGGHSIQAAPNQLVFDLAVGQSKHVTTDTPVSETNLQNPGGYFPPEPAQHRLVETVTIKNSGKSAIYDPTLIINGRPYLTVDTVSGALGIGPNPGLEEIFTKWKERTVHASSGLAANADAMEVLRTFGATQCGDDSRCLGQIVMDAGGTARSTRVEGHVAYELTLGDGRAVIDGNQRALYIKLDNTTLADEAALRADPFLTIRTKIYGRQMPYRIDGGWMNAARWKLYEHKSKEAAKPRDTADHPDWQILPGERIKFYRSSARLPRVYAKNPGQPRESALLRGAIAVAFHIDPAARRKFGREITLPFAAVGWSSSDEKIILLINDGDEPKYTIPLPKDKKKEIIIWCQAAEGIFPNLPARENSIFLESPSEAGRMQVRFSLNPDVRHLVVPDAPRVSIAGILAPHGVPQVSIELQGADKIWWQVSASDDFASLIPNFDQVADPQSKLAIGSPIEATFFSPGRPYFFRVKQRVAGVWSEWSDPLAFQIQKPTAPQIAFVSKSSHGEVTISWGPQDGALWIFGSDRLDFVPEIYANVQPLEIRNSAFGAVEPNENLLARADASAGKITLPAFAFYRTVANTGTHFSVPSDLLAIPADQRPRPAMVLQNRHESPGTDIATVTELP